MDASTGGEAMRVPTEYHVDHRALPRHALAEREDAPRIDGVYDLHDRIVEGNDAK